MAPKDEVFTVIYAAVRTDSGTCWGKWHIIL